MGQRVCSHPSIPAGTGPVLVWDNSWENKTHVFNIPSRYKGTEGGQDTLTSEHRHRRSPQLSPEATAPTLALQSEGTQPPGPRELGGKPGATQEPARMWISAAGWPKATSFPLQPSLAAPITLSCPFPSRLQLWQRKWQQQGLRCPHTP